MDSTVQIPITANTWTLVDTAFSGLLTVTKNCRYLTTINEPETPALGHSLGSFDNFPYLLETGQSLYVWCDDNAIAFRTRESRSPAGRDFDTWAEKQGYKFSASRLVTATNNVTPFLSGIQTGDNPVFLNKREFAYDDIGIIADMYHATFTGGNADPVYSGNDVTNITDSFDFQLLVGMSNVVLGTKHVPTIYGVGPAAQQSKGALLQPLGGYAVLAPNSQYVLSFRSRSTGTQNIAVRIAGYNAPWSKL